LPQLSHHFPLEAALELGEVVAVHALAQGVLGALAVFQGVQEGFVLAQEALRPLPVGGMFVGRTQGWLAGLGPLGEDQVEGQRGGGETDDPAGGAQAAVGAQAHEGDLRQGHLGVAGIGQAPVR